MLPAGVCSWDICDDEHFLKDSAGSQVSCAKPACTQAECCIKVGSGMDWFFILMPILITLMTISFAACMCYYFHFGGDDFFELWEKLREGRKVQDRQEDSE